MSKTIRFIRPASREPESLCLEDRLDFFKSRGFHILYKDQPQNPDWPYSAASINDRLSELEQALCETESQLVWCARGGYGCSDLISRINWESLKQTSWKPIVGFSDISALHSAFYTKLGWPGLHAPMPATKLWSPEGEDLKHLFSMLTKWNFRGSISVEPLSSMRLKELADFKLFGGCLSVLTNLIGTPYLPKDFSDHALFFEDTDENPGQIRRQLHQWLYSGLLDNCRALILGQFRHATKEPSDMYKFVYDPIAKEAPCPVYASHDFGHVYPNFPLMIGARAQITFDTNLEWQLNGMGV